MSGYLIALTGTPQGHRLAVALALLATVPHALFVVPGPEPWVWGIFRGAFLVHGGYKVMQAMTCDRAPYTVVYPVVRGTGLLFYKVIGAGLVFGAHFAALQWFGLLMLVGGMFGLALYNMSRVAVGGTIMPALGLALVTGGFVAAYTPYDAWGIRATADPFTFLAWFFMIDGLFIPVMTWTRWRNLDRARLLPLLKRGAFGAFVAYFSFGAAMLATRLDRVGEAAAGMEWAGT